MKKRKRSKDEEEQKEGSESTVSMTLPISMVGNAQTEELEAIIVGQVARAAVIYGVDEIVIFDDSCLKRYTSGME